MDFSCFFAITEGARKLSLCLPTKLSYVVYNQRYPFSSTDTVPTEFQWEQSEFPKI